MKRTNKTSMALDDETLAIANLLAAANGITRSEFMLRLIQTAALRAAQPERNLTIADLFHPFSRTAKGRTLGELRAALEAKANQSAVAAH
jgi:hypothetical protein